MTVENITLSSFSLSFKLHSTDAHSHQCNNLVKNCTSNSHVQVLVLFHRNRISNNRYLLHVKLKNHKGKHQLIYDALVARFIVENLYEFLLTCH